MLVPLPRPGVVVRSRLHERLLRPGAARLTAVVAPAGWGKTTLLAAWARDPAERRPVAWLSLDEADDEPVRFWTYALSALGTVAPHLVHEALAALAAPGLDPLDVALPALLNALTAEAGKVEDEAGTSGASWDGAGTRQRVLVLDDFHVLTDAAISESVEFLLAYLPSSLHLVIASRFDPPLPLARMRARGLLSEIRLRDLRCTPAEGTTLVAGLAHLPDDVMHRLHEHTEGWPAGLQLAALTMRETTDPATAEATLVGNERHIVDYVTDEVVAGLDDDQRGLLVRCSVLERLAGPLCDAVLDTSGSARVLERLERADLFVTALGGGWYRCHRLFRDVLRRQLDALAPDAGRQLLARAARWFLEHGRVEEAVEHLLAAGDGAASRDLLRRHARWFLDSGAMAAFLRLGERVANDVDDPQFLVTLAFAAGLCGRPERAAVWLREAEPLIGEDAEPLPGWQSLRSEADTISAIYAVPGDSKAALADARRAVERETDPTRWGYVAARQALAGALMGAGRMDDAAVVLEDCWRSPVREELPRLLFLQSGGQLALALVESGNLAQARRISAQVADAAAEAEREWGPGAAAAVGVLRLAEAQAVAAEDPAAALGPLHRAVQHAESWGRATVLVSSLTHLAAAQWALGHRSEARVALARAREVADTDEARPFAVRRLEELEARIGRMAGRAARSRGLLAEELTDRELAVLRALRGPLSAREIGAELYLSVNTVKGYTKSLYRKLGVVTRVEAVRRGQELGLI
jgi:LuxR family maltose regulon positive regulatory protein